MSSEYSFLRLLVVYIFIDVMCMICYLYMFLDNDLDANVENSKRKHRRLVAEKKRIFNIRKTLQLMTEIELSAQT